MNTEPPITLLLKRASRGDECASNELFALVNDELRTLASWFVRGERPGHTLQPTALVNEAYLRLLKNSPPDWANRAHFFAVASRVMRHVLVDYARARGAAKRSADPPPDLAATYTISEDKLSSVLDVDGALTRLHEIDARQAKIVEMRFFAGLTDEEIALILGVSTRTVKRDWTVAKVWLRAELGGKSARASSSAH